MLGTVVAKLLEMGNSQTSRISEQRFQDVYHRMKQEGLEILDYPIRARVQYRGYSEPGRSISSRRESFRAALFITKQRLLVINLSTCSHVIDMPWSTPALTSLIVEIDGRALRIAAADVSKFHSRKTGTIDVLLNVARPFHLRRIILSYFPDSKPSSLPPPPPFPSQTLQSGKARGYGYDDSHRRQSVVDDSSLNRHRRYSAVDSSSNRRRRSSAVDSSSHRHRRYSAVEPSSNRRRRRRSAVDSYSNRRRHSHAFRDVRRFF